MRTKPITLGIIGAIFLIGYIPTRLQSQTIDRVLDGAMPPIGQQAQPKIPKEMIKLYKYSQTLNDRYILDAAEMSEAGDLLRILLDRNGTTVDARVDAARRLGGMSSMEARIAEALLNALKDDPAPEVRAEAAWNLGAARYDQNYGWRILEALTRSLRKDPKPAVRKASIASLRQGSGNEIQDFHILMALVESVQENLESAPKVRREAIIALGLFKCRDINSPRDQAFQAHSAGDDHDDRHLPQCQDYGIFGALIQAMSKDSNEEVRKCAAATLGDLLQDNNSRDPSLLNALILASRYEKDDATRLNAVAALSLYGNNLAASATLAEVLIYDRNPEIRALAASRLGNMEENPYALTALTHAAYNDSDPDVRTQAERFLREIGSAPDTQAARKEVAEKILEIKDRVMQLLKETNQLAETAEAPDAPAPSSR